MTRGLGLLVSLLLIGCRGGPEDPPISAVQQAFRQDGLNAQQAHGRRVFAQRCATCHGLQGRGDGQNAYNLKPPPPDFQESLPGLSPADRRRVIEGGTSALGRSPLCPPFGPSLEQREIEALLAYMDVLARPSREGEEATEPGRRRWRR